jgi:hypothetical protein
LLALLGAHHILHVSRIRVNNNNSNNNKNTTNMIAVIIEANGTTSKQFRKKKKNITVNQETKELQKTAIMSNVHIMEEVLL